MDSDKIIIAPIVTEKSNDMKEKNKYVFKVDARANKYQVMRAIRDLFNLHPLKCNISNVKRKPKRLRNRMGHTSAWKKAIITLAAGEKIDIFEGA
jgi:large subunit ribosomal protein L23